MANCSLNHDGPHIPAQGCMCNNGGTSRNGISDAWKDNSTGILVFVSPNS